tara:strand:- start:817 stop:1371 length:555 start_codon:yes stop_codon:yes gene_type:complete
MFDEFLYNLYRAIRLDKNLYRDPRNFQNISFLFAGLIIIINGFAGLVAQNTFLETLKTVYGLTDFTETSFIGIIFSAILGWFIWSTLIYIIGVKLFSEKGAIVSFKNVMIVVGYGHSPGLFRFFAIIPDLLLPVIFITEIWIFLSIAAGLKEILNFKSNLKSLGVVIIAFLIILISFVYFTNKI